jgi:hypothetical protein
MNITLMPNDINLEFYFHPPEIHKSEEDIKSIYFNSSGSVIAIVTKSNLLKIYDFLGKVVIFTITHFKDNDKMINYVTWTTNSECLYVTSQKKNTSISEIKKIELNFMDSINNFFKICEENIIQFENINISQVKLLPSNINQIENENLLFISGYSPQIFNLDTKLSIEFFPMYYNNENMYTYILKETNDKNSFFIFVREIYLILLVKERTEEHLIKHKYLVENSKEKKMKNDQIEFFEYLLSNLNKEFVIVDLLAITINGEIISAQLDSSKTLILINSTDRILRLFRYDYDNLELEKEYLDSVNRKKWINAYFYTFNIKNSRQDLIVSALSDVNSLEFIFIDIFTGNFLKRLEPFKYQCSDFICHYTNHFSIVLISNKKLFHIYGYLINHWGAFAPQLKYIEENIEYIEEESFFDTFNKNLKKPPEKHQKGQFFKNLFKKENESMEKQNNLFFRYRPTVDDLQALQSEKDLKEVFHQFNEIIEINKK